MPALCTGIMSKEKSFPTPANCCLTGATEARGVPCLHLSAKSSCRSVLYQQQLSTSAGWLQVSLQGFGCSGQAVKRAGDAKPWDRWGLPGALQCLGCLSLSAQFCRAARHLCHCLSVRTEKVGGKKRCSFRHSLPALPAFVTGWESV